MDTKLKQNKIYLNKNYQSNQTITKTNYRFLIEIIVFLTYAAFGAAWAATGTFLIQFKQELGLTLSQASFMNTIVSCANIIGPALAGFIAAKINLKWSIMIASFLICFGILAPISPHYSLILLTRFLMGLGGAMTVVYLTPLTMKWFSGEERVAMNGLNFLSMQAGMTVAMLATPIIQKSLGNSWRNTLIIYSILSILLAIAWLIFGKDPKDNDKVLKTIDNEKESSYIEALKDKNTWLLILTGMGSLSLFMTLFTYFPSFYIENFPGEEGTKLARVVGYTMMAGIPASILGIIITQKTGLRCPLMRFSGVLLIPAAIGMYIFSVPSLVITCAILTGIGLQLGVPAFYCIPQELPNVNPKKAGYMMGIFWAAIYLIATFNVWTAGKIIELNNNNYILGFIYISVISSLSVIGLFMLPETGPKKSTTS